MSYSLSGFGNVFDNSFQNEIQDNMVEWLDWGLLNKGNYFNVTLGELSQDNRDMSLLQLSANNNFAAGQAWDGFRSNWIWQSGITVESGAEAPIVSDNNVIPGISGVYVDDTFYASDTTGTYAHHIDYCNGRVVFDTPIPTGSKVQAEFSYKYINVIYANNLPWIQEVSARSLFPTGDDPILPPEMEVQLPSVAVEVTSNRKFKPFALGSQGNQYVYTDVLFHCIADNVYTRNAMVDMVSLQNDKNFAIFDTNSVINSGELPINYNGSPASGALRYPDLISKHRYTDVRIRDTKSQQAISINSNVHIGVVTSTIEIIGF